MAVAANSPALTHSYWPLMSEKFDEAEAARSLIVSKATLARERLAGHIHPIRIGPRVIRYTQEILDEYRRQCPNKQDCGHCRLGQRMSIATYP
jgi:hypothetical protein